MPVITRNVLDHMSGEVEAEIEFIAHRGEPRTYWEPGEPAHAEVTRVTLTLTETSWKPAPNGLTKVVTRTVVECPQWLEKIVLRDAEDDLNYAVDEIFGDEADAAEAAAEARYEDRRSA